MPVRQEGGPVTMQDIAWRYLRQCNISSVAPCDISHVRYFNPSPYVCLCHPAGWSTILRLALGTVVCSVVLSSKVHFSDNLVKKFLYSIFSGLCGALSGQLLPYFLFVNPCEKPTRLRLACQLLFSLFKNLFVASNGALSGLAHLLTFYNCSLD